MIAEDKRYMTEKQYINKKMLICYNMVTVLLFGAYVIELVKKNRDLLYFLEISLLLIIPAVLSMIVYFKNKESHILRYVAGIGYCIMYTFSLFTANTELNFVYIVPMLVIATIFQDKIYTSVLGAMSLLINVVYIVKIILTQEVTSGQIVAFEIQIALVLMTVILLYIVAEAMGVVSKKRMDNLDAEKQKISNMLDQIVKNTQMMCEQISQINSETGNISKESEAGRIAMEEIFLGTNELAGTIQNQLAMTNEINDITQSVNSVTKELQSKFQFTKDAAEEGGKGMAELEGASEHSKQASADAQKAMADLVNGIHEVNDILKIIDEVTGQTNLLALNASIEAARAGEAGRGFAVVADEITQLSVRTSEATAEIKKTFNHLLSQMNRAENSIDELLKNNAKEAELVRASYEIFERIQGDIGRSYADIATQVSYMENIARSNSEINENVSGVSAFSEELLANTENTKHIMENIVSDIEGINRSITELNHEVEELRSIL